MIAVPGGQLLVEELPRVGPSASALSARRSKHNYMNSNNKKHHSKADHGTDGGDQETQTPSHGYNAADREGVCVADNEDTNGNGLVAEQETILLQRLRQIMQPNELSPSQKMILAVLAATANDEDISELTYDEIGARASLSRRNVATHIPLLEKAGWIKRIFNSNSYKYLYLK